MKQLFTVIILFALTACDKPYVLKITKNKAGYDGLTSPDIKSFNFKSPDDETAYSRSAEHFYKDQSVDSIMDYVTGRTISFDVLDEEGQNLRDKLPLKTTDSINRLYKKLIDGAASHMKKPLGIK